MGHRQIIIIPGISGSELKFKEYRIWPPNNAAWWKWINVVVKRLEDINNEEIQSVKAMKSVYGDLINYSSKLGDEVTVFHYDWRQNNFNHVDRLKQKINLNADEVIIIAHSMGGIVAKLFLTSDIDREILGKVSQLITLGTPWNGSAEAYMNIEYGIGIKFFRGLFKSVLPRCESIYQLLFNKIYVEENEVKFNYGYLDNKGWDSICKEYYNPILKTNGLEFDDVLSRYYEAMSRNLPENIIHHEIIGYRL